MKVFWLLSQFANQIIRLGNWQMKISGLLAVLFDHKSSRKEPCKSHRESEQEKAVQQGLLQ